MNSEAWGNVLSAQIQLNAAQKIGQLPKMPWKATQELFLGEERNILQITTSSEFSSFHLLGTKLQAERPTSNQTTEEISC